jgi:hypothetical protein
MKTALRVANIPEESFAKPSPRHAAPRKTSRARLWKSGSSDFQIVPRGQYFGPAQRALDCVALDPRGQGSQRLGLGRKA